MQYGTGSINNVLLATNVVNEAVFSYSENWS